MAAVINSSHRIYKRYQPVVEAAITGLGLGLIVGIVLAGIPVYPPNWAPVLIAVIAMVGFRWPLPAYLLAVLTLLYPIYSVSLYLAVLFLAISILIHRPASHYLGATIIILSVPILAKYQLHWAVPILAGLWWGSVNGFWIGAMAALWSKLLNGMAGLNADWLMMGEAPSIGGLMQRYHGLGSLETLSKLIEPLAPDTTILLYHLLQIAVWALVAGFVGLLAHQKWLQYGFPWSILFISALGITALGAGHLFLTIWLQKTDPATLDYDPLITVTIIGLGVSSILAVFRQALEFPVAPRRRRKKRPVAAASPSPQYNRPENNMAQSYSSAIPLPELPEWEPPDDENDDLILLELD